MASQPPVFHVGGQMSALSLAPDSVFVPGMRVHAWSALQAHSLCMCVPAGTHLPVQHFLFVPGPAGEDMDRCL